MDRVLYLVDKETDKVFHELSVKNGLVQGSVVFKNNLESVLEFTVAFEDSYIIGRNTSVLVKDSRGRLVEFDIDETENINGEEIVYYCIPRALNDLGLGKPFIEGTSFDNMTSREFFNEVLSETHYSIGEVDYVGSLTVVLEESQYPMEVIEDYIQEHELKSAFHVYINNGDIVNRVVDFQKKERIETGKEFKRGKDMLSYKTREVVSDLITAVRGVSKVSTEDSEDELLLSEEVYNDEVVKEIGGVHRWGLLESDAETVDELRAELSQKLEEVSSIHESFEVDVEDLSHFLAHEKVYVGDYVYIKDNKSSPPLILGGEITEETINLVDERDRTYVVGDIGRVRKEYDGMRDQLKKMGKRFNGLLKEISELRQRFVEIQDPVDEEEESFDFNELMHYNLMSFSNITKGRSSSSEYLNYDENLKIDFTTGTQRVGGSYGGVGVSNMNFEYGGIYTFYFRLKVEDDCDVIFNFKKGNSNNNYMITRVLVGGEDYTELTYNFRKGEEKEFLVTVVCLGENGLGGEFITFDTSDPQVDVSISDFIIYEGTAKFGTENRMRKGYLSSDIGSSYLDFDNTYNKDRSIRVKVSGNAGATSNSTGANSPLIIGMPGVERSGDVKRLKFRVKINSNESSRVEYLNFKFGFFNDQTHGIYKYGAISDKILPRVRVYNDEGELVANTSSGSVYNYTVSLIEGYDYKASGDEFNVEVAFPLKEGDGNKLIFYTYGGGAFTRVEDLDFEVKDLRMYDGMAPVGVSLEGDYEAELNELKDMMGKIEALIDGKADRVHSHSIYDVDGLQDELTGLDNNKADKEHSHVIEDVEGLSVELTGKRDVNGIIQISEVEGLSDILDDYSQRLIDGGL